MSIDRGLTALERLPFPAGKKLSAFGSVQVPNGAITNASADGVAPSRRTVNVAEDGISHEKLRTEVPRKRGTSREQLEPLVQQIDIGWRPLVIEPAGEGYSIKHP